MAKGKKSQSFTCGERGFDVSMAEDGPHIQYYSMKRHTAVTSEHCQSYETPHEAAISALSETKDDVDNTSNRVKHLY